MGNSSGKGVRTIVVYLYDIRKPYVGLGMVESNLAQRLAARAAELRADHGVALCFMVPDSHRGCFGNQVGYYGFNKWKEILFKYRFLSPLARLFFPRCALVHWTQQQPKLRQRFSPKTLVTVHDINFVHNQLSHADEEKKAKRFQRYYRNATHLAFISQFTRRDVEEHFGLTCPWRVIVNGVTDLSTTVDGVSVGDFLPDFPKEELERKPFLFHLSSLDRKKNTHLLVEMMRFLPDETLVVAGKGSHSDVQRLRGMVERYGLKNVHFAGLVSEGQKAWLYGHCRAFLFPSLSEGFGLPVVEAMHFGKPVFCSPLTSLPEVGGEAAIYFDALEPQAMAGVVADGLRSFYADAEEKARCCREQAARFDWDTMVDEYIRYYLDILEGKV